MFVASLYNLKGGVGKTASCVNFAYMAAKDGYRVLLWDLDPQGAASFYFNTQPKKNSAQKIIEGETDLADAIVETDYEGLDVLPADLSARKLDVILGESNSNKKHLRNLLKPLSNEYDFVFIDCPPGFSLLADNIFHASDAILMPVIPTTLSERTFEIVKDHLSEKGGEAEKLHCFFTMVDARKNLHQEVMGQLVRDKRFFQYYIPYLSDVEKMGVQQAPVEAFAPSSLAAASYRALWKEVQKRVLR